MKDVALIFPGQGAQKVGMGKEFFEASPEAKAVFTSADRILGVSLTDIIFNGPEDKLMSTAFCQPAIFTMSMAALAAFRATEKFHQISVRFAAGHSLGEYGALCAAGWISFEDCLRLIQRRAACMDEAAKAAPGKMAAVIGFDKDKLVEIVRTAGCEVANFNSLDQIVITGTAATVEKACQLIIEAGGKKVLPLDVSGAFHSSLMKPAADKFSVSVGQAQFTPTKVQVVTNVTANSQVAAGDVQANLPKQIYSSVQWVDSVKFIASQGITDFVEIGPGRVLKGLIRKIDPALNVQNIQTPEDVVALTF